MILRPVRPQSAWGPPSSNAPVGLTSTPKSSPANCSGSVGRITCSTRSGLIVVSESMPGACWVEMSTVTSRTGRPSSYSKVTWVLPSGRRYGRAPDLRTSARRSASRWASQIGSGMRSAVSSQA